MQIQERLALEAALRADLFLLFKHSTVCPISARAFREYEAFAAARPALPTGWIDVRGQRDLAAWVAGETGVRHASPQALLIRGGAVAWNASHGAITQKSLAAALDGGGQGG